MMISSESDSTSESSGSSLRTGWVSSISTSSASSDTGLAGAVRHVERDLADRPLAPEELVQRAADLVAGDAKQDVDARRLDVGVDDAHPLPPSRLGAPQRSRLCWASQFHRESCGPTRSLTPGPPSPAPPAAII